MSDWTRCLAGPALHETLPDWRRWPSRGTAAGRTRGLRPPIAEADLPDSVELVWHGVNDRANLRHFLASPVRWGECDVRRDPQGRLALRHDPYTSAEPPVTGGQAVQPLTADEFLRAALAGGKRVKLDVKEPDLIDELLELVGRSGAASNDLWFNGRVDVLGRQAFRRVRSACPAATVQCPIDALVPAIVANLRRPRAALDKLADWGIDRFSLAWATGPTALVLDQLDRWGHQVNLYAVDDLEEFLQAVMLLPRSVTSDFNFPEWHYFGRGAGRGGRYHRYHLEAAPSAADVA
jgi:hypothetical protein